ncbi:MAG: hypothetical protein WDW38_009377 [Sanguina aurantia]
MNQTLHAASRKVSMDLLRQPGTEAKFIQLISSLSSLVDVLAVKLDALGAASHVQMPSSAHSSNSGGSSSSSSSRNSSNDAHRDLFSQLMYLHSISLWPLSSMMTELAALPSEFITLFCCLVLEQSEALFAAVTATRANSILADPASRPPAYLRLQELNTSAWLMAIEASGRSSFQLGFGPAVTSLWQFNLLPGCVVMLEASMRDAHGPTGPASIYETVRSIMSSLQLSIKSDHVEMIAACVSLTASVQKLLNTLRLPINASSAQQQQRQQCQQQQRQQQQLALRFQESEVGKELHSMQQ